MNPKTARTKTPVNPSVRGTSRQSGRNTVGDREPGYNREGSNNEGGHGRGGKTSR